MRKTKAEQKREIFALDLEGAVSWDKLPNRGVFAVYNDTPRPGRGTVRLFVATGAAELSERLEQFQSKGMLANLSRVFVETAPSESDLIDYEYEGSVRSVLMGIERIKARSDKATLGRVRAALESKGGKPGPKANPKQNTWLVAALKELATGKPLKQVTLPKPRKSASASAMLSRFCWKFYQFCNLFDTKSPSEWQDDKAAGIIRERFGFSFPDDLTAAQEALRRGQAQLTTEDRERKLFSVRYSLRQL